MISLKCEILIIDTWNEYIKKSDELVILFFCSEFNVKDAYYLKNLKNNKTNEAITNLMQYELSQEESDLL